MSDHAPTETLAEPEKTYALLMSATAQIRTGLHTILGMTELALGTELAPKQREYLQVVRSSADSLASSLGNLVDLASMEAGRFDLDPIAFRLRDSLGYTMGSLALQAHAKGLELVSHVLAEVPDALVGDPSILRQLVSILVGRAIRQTGPGGVIVVRVELEAMQGQDVVLHLAVIRSMTASSQESRGELFELEERSLGALIPSEEPSAITPIVARLAELAGGRVWVEDQAGDDSIAHVTARFRLEPGPIDQFLPAEPGAVRGLPVLIVDDHLTNRYLLIEMLRRWDMEPVGLDTAHAALVTLERAAEAGHPFGLVLVEACLPDASGFAFAQRLRQHPKLAHTRLMMLTSGGSRGDAARCRSLGVAAYLTRPVRHSDLFDAVMTVLGAPAGKPLLVTRHSLRERRRMLQVLLVEESLVNVQLAVRVMERQGHGVIVATDGGGARSAIEHQPFDLILLDLQMPELDTRAIIAAGRESGRKHGRPVTIIGTTMHAEAQMAGQEQEELNCYLLKPFHARVLQDLLDDLGRPPLEELTTPPPVRRASDELDATEILSRVDGDLKLLTELVRLLLSDCPRLLTELRDAAVRRDARALQAAAHVLHASLMNFAAQTACELAVRLEAMAMQGRCDDAEQVCAALEHEIARLKPELKRLATRAS